MVTGFQETSGQCREDWQWSETLSEDGTRFASLSAKSSFQQRMLRHLRLQLSCFSGPTQTGRQARPGQAGRPTDTRTHAHTHTPRRTNTHTQRITKTYIHKGIETETQRRRDTQSQQRRRDARCRQPARRCPKNRHAQVHKHTYTQTQIQMHTPNQPGRHTDTQTRTSMQTHFAMDLLAQCCQAPLPHFSKLCPAGPGHDNELATALTICQA